MQISSLIQPPLSVAQGSEIHSLLSPKTKPGSQSPQSINTYDYIILSDLSIFLGGSMAIEALSLGERPLVYLPRNNFSHNWFKNDF